MLFGTADLSPLGQERDVAEAVALRRKADADIAWQTMSPLEKVVTWAVTPQNTRLLVISFIALLGLKIVFKR